MFILTDDNDIIQVKKAGSANSIPIYKELGHFPDYLKNKDVLEKLRIIDRIFRVHDIERVEIDFGKLGNIDHFIVSIYKFTSNNKSVIRLSFKSYLVDNIATFAGENLEDVVGSLIVCLGEL